MVLAILLSVLLDLRAERKTAQCRLSAGGALTMQNKLCMKSRQRAISSYRDATARLTTPRASSRYRWNAAGGGAGGNRLDTKAGGLGANQ